MQFFKEQVGKKRNKDKDRFTENLHKTPGWSRTAQSCPHASGNMRLGPPRQVGLALGEEPLSSEGPKPFISWPEMSPHF